MLLLAACLLYPAIGMTADTEYTKDVEITEADINVDHHELPPVAYLDMTVVNKSGRNIANLTVDISYYGENDVIVHKIRVKDILNEPIPAGKTKEYDLRLKGGFFNIANEQYPYSRQDKISDFDVKIVAVKYK